MQILQTACLAIGKAAEKIAPKYVKKYAVVNTVTLNVREKANTEFRLGNEDKATKIIEEYLNEK